jgi:hypothetical protein
MSHVCYLLYILFIYFVIVVVVFFELLFIFLSSNILVWFAHRICRRRRRGRLDCVSSVAAPISNCKCTASASNCTSLSCTINCTIHKHIMIILGVTSCADGDKITLALRALSSAVYILTLWDAEPRPTALLLQPQSRLRSIAPVERTRYNHKAIRIRIDARQPSTTRNNI